MKSCKATGSRCPCRYGVIVQSWIVKCELMTIIDVSIFFYFTICLVHFLCIHYRYLSKWKIVEALYLNALEAQFYLSSGYILYFTAVKQDRSQHNIVASQKGTNSNQNKSVNCQVKNVHVVVCHIFYIGQGAQASQHVFFA